LAYQCVYGGECSACGECGEKEEEHRCPVCGGICETYYKDLYGDIVGCENCVKVEQACDE